MATKRTFKVFIATSLDGFISRPDGDITWLTNPPKNRSHIPPSSDRTVFKAIEENLASVSYIVMGRGTFEKVVELGSWPYSKHQVFVLSQTMKTPANENVEIVRSIDDALKILENKDAGNVYVDGGKVIRGFLERGLIDEITITQAPIILGQGLPLFTELNSELKLTLVEECVFEGGMVLRRYKIDKE